MRFKIIYVSTPLSFFLWSWFNIRKENHFASSAKRSLQEKQKVEAEYDVPLQIVLGGGDEILELIAKTPFLKAGLEQSIKDFLNQECPEFSDITSYYRIDLEIPKKATNRRLQVENTSNSCVLPDTMSKTVDNANCYLNVHSKCRGKRNECQDRVSGLFSDTLRIISSEEGMKTDHCISNPLEFFDERKLALATFKYMPADTLGDSVDVDFSFSFEPGTINLKEKIGNISAEALDPVESETDCTKTSCTDQRQILKDIYNDFGLDLNEDTHECEHLGINCDGENRITHIWLGKMTLYLYFFNENTSFISQLFYALRQQRSERKNY